MATQSGYIFDFNAIAGADLSAKQYFFVKLSGNIVNNTPEVVIASAATDDVIGVLQNKPTSGQVAQVRVLGTSKLVVDGSGTAIAVKDPIGPNASSKGIKHASAGNMVAGRALQASAGSADVIQVLMLPFSTYQTPA